MQPDNVNANYEHSKTKSMHNMHLNEMRPVLFGEVLYDIFPDGNMVLGGAPFNVAWHLQAFNVNPLLISCIGDDELGSKIIDRMRYWGMDTTAIQKDNEHATGKVQITFKNNGPEYKIINNCAYDFISMLKLPELENDFLLYHGTLASRNISSRQALDKLRAHHPVNIFIDVNLRMPWFEVDQVLDSMKGVRWIKLNQDELYILQQNDQNKNVYELAELLMKSVQADNIIVTRTEKGSFILGCKGEELEVRPKKDINIVDTVGAGDAYSSIFILGMLKNWDLKIIIERAQIFASAIAGQRGAIVDDVRFYSQFTKEWCLK